MVIEANDRCYLRIGIAAPGSNGRRELLFLVGDEPEEFTLHASVDFPGESPLNFPETEGPRDGPAGSPPGFLTGLNRCGLTHFR